MLAAHDEAPALMMAAWLHQVAGLRIPAPRIERGRRPLWAFVWPAGLVLAELVANELAPQLTGKKLLELGCGLGAVGLSAAKIGARTTLSDREQGALDQARSIAAENSLTIETLLLEWARIPEAYVGTFEVILAADVVYDPSQLSPLFGAIHSLLVPGGRAWLADPDRAEAGNLEASADRAGLDLHHFLSVTSPPVVPTSDDSHRQPVHVYELHRR
jgi:predicted nicotinamide N-methyase